MAKAAGVSPAMGETAYAAFMASLGLNAVRIPVNDRHFEDDARLFELLEAGFRRLDCAIDLAPFEPVWVSP